MSYGENYTTPCSSCYQYSLPACAASTGFFEIKGALGVETELRWYVEDKFGHITTGTATTDDSGTILIPLDEFPEGYFTPWSGVFTIYFKAEDSDTEVIEMTFGEEDYSCIKLTFSDIDSENLTIE